MTAAAGFRAAGVAAGLKSAGPDVAVVVNDGPRRCAAGVLTTNRVKAAPVLWTQQVLRAGVVRAVVLNSGGANACTGPAGFEDTHATAERAAAGLGIGAVEVAVCSTGLIGQRLDLAALLPGVDAAVAGLAADGGADAAEAIRTTDTVRKQAAVRGSGWTAGGMAKGAGMLAPALATMLAVITTDAVLEPADADGCLRQAVGRTFERLDADGCLSTNDTVLLLASGASGVPVGPAEFGAALTGLCADLAGQLLADAEGATKQVRIRVCSAATEDDAVQVARAVARNSLLKCALYGSDPNWGRVLAAVGTTRAAFEPDRLAVTMNGVRVCVDGAAAAQREAVDLSGRDVEITIDLDAGTEQATVWTTDLSMAYVHENSAYST